MTSIYSVQIARSHRDPYTRPEASASPTATASDIDNREMTSVITAARASDGKYVSELAAAATAVVAVARSRKTRPKNLACESSHTLQRRKICSSEPSRIA